MRTKPKYRCSSKKGRLFGLLLVLMLIMNLVPYAGFAADIGGDGGNISGENGYTDGSGSKDSDGDLDGTLDNDPGDEEDGTLGDGSDDGEGSTESDPTTPTDPDEKTTGSIAGILWVDGNGMLSTSWNGLLDEEEPPLANFVVSLYLAEDLTTAIATTTTKDDGSYVFADLEPGEYVLGLAPGMVGAKEYLVPFAITADNKFAIDATTFEAAFTDIITLEAGQEVVGINAGMRLPMGVSPLAYDGIIDLSETTTGDPIAGYTVNGSTTAFSATLGAGGTGIINPDRELSFTTAANGKTFLIIQSGLRTVTPVAGHPKHGTSIFRSIFIETNVNVTLVIESIDMIGPDTSVVPPPNRTAIEVRGNGNLTLLLATDTTFLGSGNTIGSFIHGSVRAPHTSGPGTPTTATLTIDDYNVSGSSGSSLDVMDTRNNQAGIGGFYDGSTRFASSAGNININGGRITVDLASQTTGRSGAAIGGAYFGTAGTLVINGGTVYASSNNNGAAIGGGQDAETGKITINGGLVTATTIPASLPGMPSPNNTAIGNGNFSSPSNKPANNSGVITITGGTVNATAYGNGAAIGGSAGFDGGTIIISGGTVNARNLAPFTIDGGAGIGGGGANSSFAVGGTGGLISITNNAVVEAIGILGSGIGGGAKSPFGATLNISSTATVKAFTYHAISKPAIHANGANLGNGYYVNAVLDKAIATTPVEILVFNAGYTGGNPAARIDSFMLPGYIGVAGATSGFVRFAYTTGTSTARSDNLYANLGHSDYLGATDYRVIDRQFDNNKVIPSTNDLTSYDPYVVPPTVAGTGVLPVKLRILTVAGVPSSDNIGKYDADLISTGHGLGDGVFVDGGFRYSETVTVSGRPDTPVSMSWALTPTTFITTPITKNTMTRLAPDPELVPNTRYYVITYITTYADFWLTPVGPNDFTFESTSVHQLVTLPHISDGSVAPGASLTQVKISATFEGGNEPLRAWIYWDTASINPNIPASWAAHNSVELPATAFTSAGFTDFLINGLTPGLEYNFLIVIENETGYAWYALTNDTVTDLVFYKVNELNAPMPGVNFALYECTLGGISATHVEHDWLATSDAGNCWGNPRNFTSATDGRVEFNLLEPGDYMLVELNTLPGYQIPLGQWLISIDNSLAISISAHGIGGKGNTDTLPPAFKVGPVGEMLLPNYKQMVIPRAGGIGLVVPTALGIVLLGDALIFSLLSKRKKKLKEQLE